MKKLSLLCLLMLVLTGCGVDWGSTPAYTSRERNQQIWRNWNYEGAQMVDDWDHFWLLRPSSSLTLWNVHSSW